ncbi:MAG: hypothetical protein KBG15_04710 [Kofleriaceae bacterium]|nr:hypothetical protein [Kofleriaceae bacterium]
MRHSDSIETLMRGPVDWYTRDDGAGWSTAIDGHVALLAGDQAHGYSVAFRSATQTMAALPSGWKLQGAYPASTQSLSERSEAVAAQLLAAVERNPATTASTQVIAAWDLCPMRASWLGEYDVGPSGARLGEQRQVPDDQRDAVLDALAKRHVALGATYQGGPAVWTFADALHGGVWSPTGQKLVGSNVEFTLGFRTVAGGDVTAIESFVDADDLGHRGVRLMLGDQDAIVVIEQYDSAVHDNPAYGRDNAAVDAAWASALGRDLAAWLNVPHHDAV